METTNTTTPVQEDKTVAIIAYITLIGFIVAIVMHGSNKTDRLYFILFRMNALNQKIFEHI